MKKKKGVRKTAKKQRAPTNKLGDSRLTLLFGLVATLTALLIGLTPILFKVSEPPITKDLPTAIPGLLILAIGLFVYMSSILYLAAVLASLVIELYVYQKGPANQNQRKVREVVFDFVCKGPIDFVILNTLWFMMAIVSFIVFLLVVLLFFSFSWYVALIAFAIIPVSYWLSRLKPKKIVKISKFRWALWLIIIALGIVYLLMYSMSYFISGYEVKFDKPAYYVNDSVNIIVVPRGLSTTITNLRLNHNMSLYQSSQWPNKSPVYQHINSTDLLNVNSPYLVIEYTYKSVFFKAVSREIVYIPYFNYEDSDKITHITYNVNNTSIYTFNYYNLSNNS